MQIGGFVFQENSQLSPVSHQREVFPSRAAAFSTTIRSGTVFYVPLTAFCSAVSHQFAVFPYLL